jgi:hypothetical protein
MSFTTSPKTRKRGYFSSGCIAKDFMRHLWNKNLRVKASYDTLKFEFLQFSGGCDDRTLVKYLGKPSQVIRYSAVDVVRMERQSGRLAQFEYHTKRKTMPRKGLLERLEYISDLKNGSFKLNHEVFGYFTEQTPLSPTGDNEQEVSPLTPLQETNDKECSEAFIDGVCVCSIEAERGYRETTSDVVKRETREKEEEETIECTHTHQLGETNFSLQTTTEKGLNPKRCQAKKPLRFHLKSGTS